MKTRILYRISNQQPHSIFCVTVIEGWRMGNHAIHAAADAFGVSIEMINSY